MSWSNNKTKDGFWVNNIIQDGVCAGDECKRVQVQRTDGCGYDWWKCESIDEARIFVGNAHRFTREELVKDLGS